MGVLKAIKELGESPQKYIKRFHTSHASRYEPIMSEGIKTGMHPVEQLALPLNKRIPSVFTTTRQPGGIWNYEGNLVSSYGPSQNPINYTNKSYPTHITFELDIPKDEYRKLKRVAHNPEKPEDYSGKYKWIPSNEYSEEGRAIPMRVKVDDWGEDLSVPLTEDKELRSVQDHGRTDIFDEDLKPEWIKKVWCGDSFRPHECTAEEIQDMLTRWR